jgi:flagellar hook-basal body complex protein FliE
MAITPIGIPGSFTPPTLLPTTPGPADQPFADTLTRIVNKVEQSGAAANDAIGRMLDGSGDVHEAMIAIQNADTTFQLAVQVRNKIVQAYQEIMRMPV